MTDAKLAPSPTRPAPAPEPRPMPKPKERRIPRMVVAATEVLLNGQAQTLKQAAEQVGCSREYLSRVLSERPDAVQYMKTRAARVLAISPTVAAAKMASLIHAESEHVAFRASEHVLGVAGIAPAPAPSVSVNIDFKAGYIIDLTPSDEAERQEIERQAKIINGVAKVIDEKPD